MRLRVETSAEGSWTLSKRRENVFRERATSVAVGASMEASLAREEAWEEDPSKLAFRSKVDSVCPRFPFFGLVVKPFDRSSEDFTDVQKAISLTGRTLSVILLGIASVKLPDRLFRTGSAMKEFRRDPNRSTSVEFRRF